MFQAVDKVTGWTNPEIWINKGLIQSDCSVAGPLNAHIKIRKSDSD